MRKLQRLKPIFIRYQWLIILRQLIDLLKVMVQGFIDTYYLQERKIPKFSNEGWQVVEFENSTGYHHGEELN